MGSACSTVNCSYFSVLPPELNLHILTFLNAKDLASVALVNREWHRLASDEALWKGLCDKRWRARNAARLEKESSSLSLASPHSPADDYDECSEDNGRVRPPDPYLTHRMHSFAYARFFDSSKSGSPSCRRRSVTSEAGRTYSSTESGWTTTGALARTLASSLWLGTSRRCAAVSTTMKKSSPAPSMLP